MNISVLVVEDSPTQAEKMRFILEEQGYLVTHAKNGKEAIGTLAVIKPDIIISDIIMPEMDGYELCRYIKSNDRFKNIPVMLVTALSDPDDVIKSLEAGASNFLRKPYNEKHLLSLIERILMNMGLRKGDKNTGTARVFFKGHEYEITADRYQILDLLLSTFETAVTQNEELVKTRDELRLINEELEKRVLERTAALTLEISERKRAEHELKLKNEEIQTISQQLWQASKLATMGELAASIAHELNNPLAIVSLRMESILMNIAEEDPKKESLEIIEKEIDRMGRLVANLLQFSRRSTQEISTIDICKEIEGAIDLVYYHFRKRKTEVVKEYVPGIPMIHADRQQLRQLFLNLFTNASDAMPSGGTLTISVSKENRTETPSTTAHNSEGNGEYEECSGDIIVIRIADTGEGISSENLSKVMEPFYTTKPEGKGTGLGLPICKRIVREHHGTLKIESAIGKGTIIEITLPVLGTNHYDYIREGN